jgi:hypothetical protein
MTDRKLTSWPRRIWKAMNVGTPKSGKVLFSESKDEIDLEKPKANEAALEISEETVNYVAEYVYDTKLP